MRLELINPRMFVRFWFQTVKKFIMMPNGHFDGLSKDVFGGLWLDYEELHAAEIIKIGAFEPTTGKRIIFPKINEKNMEKAWVEFISVEAKTVAKKQIELLAFNPRATDAPLHTWVSGALGRLTDFELAAIKHSLWQIKRKLNKQKVVYHLSPAFVGKQGGGKTEAVKRIIEPLSFLTLEWGVNDAVDSRNTQTLADNYICLFDEMAGLQRVEIEGLKRVITAEYLNYRPLRTNDQIRVPQNCTFIGISNKSLSENIYDSTGMRRFVEFRCLDDLDWAKINSVNPYEIWQSIDESLDRGYIEGYQSELKAHQESLIVQDELQHFVQDMELVDPSAETKEVLALELYNAYITWRSLNGYGVKPALALTWFCLKLRSHNLNKRIVKINKKEKTAYAISANSDIFKTSDELTTINRKVLEFKK